MCLLDHIRIRPKANVLWHNCQLKTKHLIGKPVYICYSSQYTGLLCGIVYLSDLYPQKKILFDIFGWFALAVNEYYIFSFGITSDLHIVPRIFIHTSDEALPKHRHNILLRNITFPYVWILFSNLFFAQQQQ